jgi:hypothetical protein
MCENSLVVAGLNELGLTDPTRFIFDDGTAVKKLEVFFRSSS